MHYDMQDTSSRHQVHSDWYVAELPIGYVKVDHRALKVPGKATPVDQMIFSDGIRLSFTVFIEPLNKGMRPKTGRMGSRFYQYLRQCDWMVTKLPW